MSDWYYHPVTGNDTTGDGSSGNPYKTPNKCYTVLTSGDTIYAQSSTTAGVWASLTITKSFTIKGTTTDPSNHILDASNASVQWNITTSSVSVTKQYMTFRNGIMSSREGIFAMNNNTTGPTSSAFYASNCIVHSIACSANDWGCAIWTQGYNSGTNCILDVRKCYIHNLSRSAAANKIRVIGHYISTGITVKFYNNYVYSESGITYPLSGVFSSAGAAGTLWDYNNVFHDAASTSIPSTPTGVFNTINKATNNCYGFASDGSTGVFTTNPLPVDLATGNVNPQTGSPLWRAGTAITN